MKSVKAKRVIFSLSIGIALISFMACDNPQIRDFPEETFTVEALANTVFFSLTDGREVDASEIGTTAWDIAFPRPVRTGIDEPDDPERGLVRVLWTNSGRTAERLNTGGQGGSWFAGTTNFDQVQSPSAAVQSYQNCGALLPYYDHYVWMLNMENIGGVAVPGNPPAVKRESSNVMNYLGWRDGDGTFYDGYFFLMYDARMWFTMVVADGAAQFTMTENVYIIRHACGQRYSAIQFVDYRTAAPGATPPVTERFVFQVRNF